MTTLYQGQLQSWQYYSVVCRYNSKCVYVHNQECTSAFTSKEKTHYFNKYISRHTNISLTETCLANWAQIGLCPHKVDLTANLAAHDIYDQLIQSIQYSHTLWPCSCPCPTNKHVPHSQLINRISHLAWLILSISPAGTWYEYKVSD